MFRASFSLPAVVASAWAMRVAIASLKRDRSPMKRMRTPRRCSSSTSRSRALMNSFISAPTSSSGRPQFSLENANRVSAPMPRSRQKSTVRSAARAPARWPTTRGRRRRCAQRPLPSMMTPRWRGPGARAGEDTAVLRMADRSDRHQFLFLGLDHVIDILDRLVGDLLDVVLGTTHVVLGDLLFLQQVLDLLVGVAADVAHGDLGVLALAGDDLGQLAAALLGQRGEVQADGGAGGVRGQAQVRTQDGLLDRADHALVPRGDDQRARVGDRHGCHLRQRNVAAVGRDRDAVDQAGGGPPGADLDEVVAQRLDALGHARLRVLLDLIDHRRVSWWSRIGRLYG